MSDSEPEASRDRPYVLLGAGFSKAISPDMPTLLQLGGLIRERLHLNDDHFENFGNNLEEWMSYLSVDQPWLSDSDNKRHRALFQEASQAVHDAIKAQEDKLIQTPPPTWLLRLVRTWSEAQASVATFNYDVLVERAVTHIGRASTWSDLYGMSLEARNAPGENLMLASAQPTGPVPEIFKLHGSTNWSYNGLEAPTNDRVVLTREGGRWNADPVATRNSPRNSVVFDDLVPLIIPPTMTKSAYYSNRSVRAQWARASKKLQSATSLTVIGYSFPPGDLGARHFLADSLPDIPVVVVDYDHTVAERIQGMLRHHTVTGAFTGQNAVRDYVGSVADNIVRWRVLRDDDPELGVQVHISQNDVDMLPGVDRRDPPWDTSGASTLDWVRDVLDAKWPDIIGKAVSDAPMPRGHNTPIEAKMGFSAHTREAAAAVPARTS